VWSITATYREFTRVTQIANASIKAAASLTRVYDREEFLAAPAAQVTRISRAQSTLCGVIFDRDARATRIQIPRNPAIEPGWRELVKALGLEQSVDLSTDRFIASASCPIGHRGLVSRIRRMMIAELARGIQAVQQENVP